jgi:hypothetical protein
LFPETERPRLARKLTTEHPTVTIGRMAASHFRRDVHDQVDCPNRVLTRMERHEGPIAGANPIVEMARNQE